MPGPLTADETAKITMHLGWELAAPSDYVQMTLRPTLNAIVDEAVLAVARDLLAKCETFWERMAKSGTKQELDAAGDVKFHKRGEHRLLATHRVFATRLAKACGVKTNFKARTGGGIRYQ